MSDTPRTDSLLTAILDSDGYVAHRNCPPPWVSHARELERELNAANVEIEEKRKDVVWLATEKAKLENYVILLEEAGDELVGTAEAMDAWRKAKEAKP